MCLNRALLLSSAVVLLLSGCQLFGDKNKVDYRNTRTVPPLEVPPDLTGLPAVESPGGASSAARPSEIASAQQPQQPSTGAVLPEYPGITLARDGQTRWLVVKAEPQALWEPVREFVLTNGMIIADENPEIGVIETDWAEDRAKIGTGGQKLLAKWLGSLYSTGMRDKYRLRLERGVAPGTTEIYLSHQGMEEYIPEDNRASGSGGSMWRPRATDAELEAKMLQGLSAHLGGHRTAAKPAPAPAPSAAPASPGPPDTAAKTTTPPASSNAALQRNGSGAPVLSLQDSLDRAWRRVGLSLDRIGFTVEDRDRSKGVYYVRYIDPDQPGRNKGILSRWFGSDDKRPQDQYQVQLTAKDTGTDVEVLGKDGTPEASKTGERILSLLYEQLK